MQLMVYRPQAITTKQGALKKPGILTRALGALGVKTVTEMPMSLQHPGPWTRLGFGSWAIPRNSDMPAYEYVFQNAYRQNSDVFSCVRIITKASRQIRWDVYDEDDLTGKKKQVTATPGAAALAKLIRRPNPKQSWADLVEAIQGHDLLAGNAYLYGVWPGDGLPASKGDFPREIWAIRPDRVKIIPSLNASAPPGTVAQLRSECGQGQASEQDRSAEDLAYQRSESLQRSLWDVDDRSDRLPD
jgi:hypothetical protein